MVLTQMTFPKCVQIVLNFHCSFTYLFAGSEIWCKFVPGEFIQPSLVCSTLPVPSDMFAHPSLVVDAIFLVHYSLLEAKHFMGLN